MAELLPDKLGQSDPAEPLPGTREERRKPKGKRVASVLQWVECFHSYIGVVVQQDPSRVQELLAYASLVVHAARKYKGEGWATYDRNFRKRAAAHPGEKWGELNMPLWTLAFCNAQPRDHCSICLSLDHATTACDEYEAPDESRAGNQTPARPQKQRASGNPRGKQPICINWNRSSCTSATCDYQHICLECHQRHREKDCPTARRFSPYHKEKPGRKERDKEPFQGKGPTLQ
jgi:hypothetical protein